MSFFFFSFFSSSVLSFSSSLPLSSSPHTACGLLVGRSPTRVSIGARRLELYAAVLVVEGAIFLGWRFCFYIFSSKR